MGSIRPVAVAITICLALIAGKALGSAQSKDSSKVSNSTSSAQGDEAFAGYLRVTPGITPPKAIHSPDPEYPDLPPDTEPKAVVVMLVGIDTRGHVGPVHVVRSSGEVFEKSAVATVKTWRFKPAKREGKAVPVQITVEMTFAK